MLAGGHENGDTIMQRRKFIIGAGALAAGGAAALGSGAFNIARAERDVEVEVVGDEAAYLGLNATSAYADGTADGQLEIDFGDNGQGEGLNENAKFFFTDVFEIRNQGTEDVEITVGTGDNTAYDLNNPVIVWTDGQMNQYNRFPGDLTDAPDVDEEGDWSGEITGSRERPTLAPGESVYVHFLLDNLEEIIEDPNDPDELDKITIYGEAQ